MPPPCGGAPNPHVPAQLTLLRTARQIDILDQGGYYMMIVKRNQPQLHDDLALFFDLPAIIAADQEHWDQHQTTTKGHGRIELRNLSHRAEDRQMHRHRDDVWYHSCAAD
jgi:hypothetical protein